MVSARVSLGSRGAKPSSAWARRESQYQKTWPISAETGSISPSIGFDKILIWRNDLTPCAPLRAFLQLWREFRDVDEEGEKTA